jgi:phospholipase A-2-activating protein
MYHHRRTTKIWKNWQEACTLEGHSHAVWAVLAVDDDLIFTGECDSINFFYKQVINYMKIPIFRIS